MLEQRDGQRVNPEAEVPGPKLITVNYEGVLSDRLNWNKGVLRVFEDRSHLRTRIAIVSGTLNDRNQTVQMGDTLALRKSTDASVLFDAHSQPSRLLDVTTNFQSGQAVIAIDDQGIADEIMKKSRTFNQGEFADKMDALTKEGLKTVLGKEKRMLAQLALEFDSHIAITAVMTLTALYCLNNIVQDAITTLTSNNATDKVPDALLQLGIMAGLLKVETVAFDKVDNYLDSKVEERLNMDSYDANSTADVYLPPVHLVRSHNGKAYLDKKGVRIASL